LDAQGQSDVVYVQDGALDSIIMFASC
jgi:hypothetical protein